MFKGDREKMSETGRLPVYLGGLTGLYLDLLQNQSQNFNWALFLLVTISTGHYFYWALFLLDTISTGDYFYWSLFLLVTISTGHYFNWSNHSFQIYEKPSNACC